MEVMIVWEIVIKGSSDIFELSAGVAELVDALVLGTSGAIRGGSSPLARTMQSFLVRQLVAAEIVCKDSFRRLPAACGDNLYRICKIQVIFLQKLFRFSLFCSQVPK